MGEGDIVGQVRHLLFSYICQHVTVLHYVQSVFVSAQFCLSSQLLVAVPISLKVPVPKSLENDFSINLQTHGHFSNQYIIQGDKIEKLYFFWK